MYFCHIRQIIKHYLASLYCICRFLPINSINSYLAPFKIKILKYLNLFQPPIEDDPTLRVTAQLVEKKAVNFVAHAHKNLCRSNAERKRLTAAKYMSIELFLARDPPEFITSYLNDNHKFRTLHNKALLSNL